jgi:hypothetical protein
MDPPPAVDAAAMSDRVAPNMSVEASRNAVSDFAVD